MSNWQEAVYYNSPVFIQNALVSMLGYKLRRERYTAQGDSMLSLLLE